MKLKASLLVTLLALPLSAVMAQDKIVAPSPKSSVTLDLYEKPGAVEAVSQINVSEAGLPWPIQDKQAGFYKVMLGDKEYWVRSSKVRVSRATTASCGVVALASSSLTAATPGAGKDACK